MLFAALGRGLAHLSWAYARSGHLDFPLSDANPGNTDVCFGLGIIGEACTRKRQN